MPERFGLEEENALEFRVLGPLEVSRNGVPLRLGGERQRALLAFLLLRANAVVRGEELIDALFDGRHASGSTNALQVAISRLRRVLDDGGGSGALETRSPGYVLHVDAERFDLALHERLAAEGRRALLAGDAAGAAKQLRRALALWRGPALLDLALVEFAQPEIRRIEEFRLAALADRIDADLELGGGSELVPELEALVAANPLQERPRGQLMLALYRAGRQADALALYRQTREFLSDELGLEPSRALQDLERSILRQEPALDPGSGAASAAPPEAAAVCPFKGLAHYETDYAEYFFGRERIVYAVISKLAAGSFVGLIGSSGVGKSSVLRAGSSPRSLPVRSPGVRDGGWRLCVPARAL